MEKWLVHSVHEPELDALYRQTVGHDQQVISVTQASPGEGSTTCAVALARRAAAAGRTVVLVDANVLRPDLTESLSLPRTHWLPGDGSARGAMYHVPDLGVSILPAPNVADPLAFRESATLRRTFNSDLEEFDLVVVDTSPVNEPNCNAIPPEVVAAASTATVLVILAGVTSEQSVTRAIGRLTQSGGTVAGAVINDRFNPTLVAELRRHSRFFSKIAPGLTESMLRRVESSPWFADHAR